MAKCAFIPNFLRFYNILWHCALPFLRRNRRLSPTLEKRICGTHLPPSDIWIQAASAGEAFLALSILASLDLPGPARVLVTATTDQGLDILKKGLRTGHLPGNLEARADVFPFDLPKVTKAAVRQVNPKVMVLLETEIWPGLLHALKTHQVKTLILNARMSAKSFRHYRWTRRFWQHLSPDRVMAVSSEDENRYRAVFKGIKTSTMPNIKFDIMTAADLTDRSDVLLLFPGPLPLSILASFRRQEEDAVMELIQKLTARVPDQVIALFPRHMHRIKALKRKLSKAGIDFVLRSAIDTPVTSPRVILWDRFGELRDAYGLASTVFVGGSLAPLGGQNFLEPAVLGIPTTIGPHWTDFAWVGEDFFDLDFVHCCQDVSDVAGTMAKSLEAMPDRGKNLAAAEDFIRKRKGGSTAACRAIARALGPN